MQRTLGLSVLASIIFLYIVYLQSVIVSPKMGIAEADFEVFGRVQGVFFRKHTQLQAENLGVRGWCMNTRDGTVKGHIEGPPETLPMMMIWLERQGSPSSKIEKVIFSGQRTKLEYDFTNFEIRTE